MSSSLREKIIHRMQLLDIQPKRSLGQNFLVSDRVVNQIIAQSEAQKFKKVFEIGPGLGALTDSLITSSKDLTLLEMDRKFADLWRQEKQQVVEGDALKYDWQSESFNDQDHLLVSNLPYQISARLVVDLSLLRPSFARMVLMFQKEVAQRIMAAPGTSDYGLLTVAAQIFWKIHIVVDAGSVDFMPKPNVGSRVLRFERCDRFPQEEEAKSFFEFVKLCFANRRKKLLPKLVSYKKREDLEALFSDLGHSSDVRVEKLAPEALLELYLCLKKE